MATGLMEGYKNTTPTGMEGVGGNAPKEAVVPPMMNEGRAPMGEEMTDGGMTANQTGGLLDTQEDMQIASTFSPDQLALAKKILSKIPGASPEILAELDKIKTEEMIHIPVNALMQNPQGVMAQLEQVVAQMDTNTVNQQPDSGMMSEGNMPDTTNRPPVV